MRYPFRCPNGEPDEHSPETNRAAGPAPFPIRRQKRGRRPRHGHKKIVDNNPRQQPPPEQRNRPQPQPPNHPGPNHHPGENKGEEERRRREQQPDPDPERGTAPGRAAYGGAVPGLAGRPHRALAIEQNKLILFSFCKKLNKIRVLFTAAAPAAAAPPLSPRGGVSDFSPVPAVGVTFPRRSSSLYAGSLRG